MTTHEPKGRVWRWSGSVVMAGVLFMAGASPLEAQSPRPNDPPPADPGASHDRTGPGENHIQNEPEQRKRVREAIAKRLEIRRREAQELEQILNRFDEGKTLDELRALFPEMRLGQRGEGREQFIRRWEENGGNGGSGDGADGNRANGGGGRGQSADPPHPLTAEEREVVREILRETGPKILASIEQQNPADAEQKYTEAFQRSRYLIDLRKRDLDMYRLRLEDIRHGRQAGEAARAIADLDSPPKGAPAKTAEAAAVERKERMDALRTALRGQYDVRTKIMQRDSDRITKDLSTRSSQEDDSIEKIIRDMLEREKRKRDKQGPDGEHHAAPGSADHKPAPTEHAAPPGSHP